MKQAFALVGVALVSALCGVVLGEHLILSQVEKKLEEAYEKGKTDFTIQDVKGLDHAELNKVCKAWWFDMTHLDRKLDVPLRKLKGQK